MTTPTKTEVLAALEASDMDTPDGRMLTAGAVDALWAIIEAHEVKYTQNVTDTGTWRCSGCTWTLSAWAAVRVSTPNCPNGLRVVALAAQHLLKGE
jgi:hypothetical protein